MIPERVATIARELGFSHVREVTLSSGELVYLLVSGDGEIVGPPVYLHYANGVISVSNAKESMAMLSEPQFMEVTDD